MSWHVHQQFLFPGWNQRNGGRGGCTVKVRLATIKETRDSSPSFMVLASQGQHWMEVASLQSTSLASQLPHPSGPIPFYFLLIPLHPTFKVYVNTWRWPNSIPFCPAIWRDMTPIWGGLIPFRPPGQPCFWRTTVGGSLIPFHSCLFRAMAQLDSSITHRMVPMKKSDQHYGIWYPYMPSISLSFSNAHKFSSSTQQPQ